MEVWIRIAPSNVDTAQKMKFSIEDLVTFIEEILNGKLQSLGSVI